MQQVGFGVFSCLLNHVFFGFFFLFLCQYFYKIFNISKFITLLSFLSEIKIVATSTEEKKHRKEKQNQKGHGPQRSPKCTAMKAYFSQNTVNVVYKKIFYCIFNLAFRLPWQQIKVSGFDKQCGW